MLFGLVFECEKKGQELISSKCPFRMTFLNREIDYEERYLPHSQDRLKDDENLYIFYIDVLLAFS